ncbi:hypothetical protein PInf_018508 [Phytophthora infestans]|nr:hypothetical protein PInf_018508 [Phytophthora infestans]
MTKDERADAAVLLDVTQFLANCKAPSALVDQHSNTPPSFSDDGLLLATQQLVAETEVLLSSLETPPQEPTAPSTLSIPKGSTSTSYEQQPVHTDRTSAEQTREIRNAQAAKRRLKHRQKLKDEKNSLQQQQLELQKEKRLEAQQTQRQLRAEVVGRARMIHQMKTLLQPPHSTEQKSQTDAAQGGDSVLFKTFVDELDAIYAQTDARIQGGKADVSSRFAYNLRRNQENGVMFYDSSDATEIPLGYEDTSRAISSLMMTNAGVIRHNDNVQELRDTVTAKYIVKCPLERGKAADQEVYTAIRRVEEADRVVFVWRALIEGQGHLSEYHMDETLLFFFRKM